MGKIPFTMGLVMAAAALAIGAAAAYGSARKSPDNIEVVGPFEVVTHTKRYMTGWNTGRLGTATTEHYSLRFRGKPFAFDGKAGLWGLGDETKRYTTFHSIITFPSPEPAVVVNVGDPNNTSFFYLVREEGGKAVAQYLGQSSGGVSAEWLDPPGNEVLDEKTITLHRRHLEGGRWLLLGEYTVLDTRSLKSYAVRPAEGFSPNNFKPTIAIKGRSFVRYGSSTDSSNYPMLAVFEIESGSSYTLPIDKARMRYNDWVEIDAAWLYHHFEWKKAKDGHLRLSERTKFEPLPYSGRLRNDHGHREYNLKPVKPEMRDRFIAFLENEYGAKIQPRTPNSPADEFLVGQRKINVMLYKDSLGIWMDTGTDSQFVEEIAKKFDRVLATRELDDLFATSPSDRHAPPASATGRAGNFRATVVLTEHEAAFQEVWNRPTTVRQPPIRTLNHVTVGKPVYAFVLFSGCARDAKGSGSLKASFDVVRPDGSIVVTVNDIPLWNAPAPPETHLQMAQQRLEIVFDEEERPGTYRIRCLVCDQIADHCVELSLPFEFVAH